MEGWSAVELKQLLAWATDAWGVWLIGAILLYAVVHVVCRLGAAYIRARFKSED